MKVMKSILLLAVSIIVSLTLFGQKKFQVTLSFPPALDLTKLKILIDNGLGRQTTDYKVSNINQIILSGVCYSRSAAIVFRYPQSENMDFGNYFFLSDQPAAIKFLPAAKDSSPFDRYILRNAFDFKSERNKIDALIAPEVTEAKEYYAKYGSLVFDGKHQDIEDRFFELNKAVYLKGLDYIKETPTSYFSFWYFRSNIQYTGLPADSILSIFDHTFPASMRNSTEGHAFRQLLVGKIETKVGNQAAQFIAKDINGNAVALTSFKDKKYVLLDFWATWCGPCIKKMPILNELRKKYSKELEIISIAYPTSISQVKDEISKQKMNWINIYNDKNLINSYGGMGAIPRLFLIDKSGKIVYDNQKVIDVDLNKLESILIENISQN